MLKIAGPVTPLGYYDRVAMTDGLGKVSAFIRPTYVTYRPLGGTVEERRVRALMIAAEQGGEHRESEQPNTSSLAHTVVVKFV